MTDKKELDMTEHEKCIHYPICLVNNYIHKRCGYYVEEPKQGEWNVRHDTMYHFECPFCKYLHQYKDNFCPNCGARMKGGDEK